MSQNSIDVQSFIDEIPLSSLQKLIMWLCFLIVAIDGFDTAAVGFIAPALKAEWGLQATDLAPLFGAGADLLLGGTAPDPVLLFPKLTSMYSGRGGINFGLGSCHCKTKKISESARQISPV